MPGKGRPFERGNKAAVGHHKGRPRLEVTSLADTAARRVLEEDLRLLELGASGKRVPRTELHRAKERISRMCKGRIPTRIAIAGDGDNPTPIPFAYIEVGRASGEKAPAKVEVPKEGRE